MVSLVGQSDDARIYFDLGHKDRKKVGFEGASLSYHWNKHYQVKWAASLFVGILLVYSVRASMSICVSAIGRDLNWNKQMSGSVLSSFFCGYLTTNILGGYLADRFGGEVIIYYSSLAWGILTVAIPFVTRWEVSFQSSTAAVMVLRFLTGVAQGVFFPSVTSMLAKHVDVSERCIIYSFAFSGSSVGIIITGFAGSLMIEKLGWPSVFYSAGACALLWACWLRYLHKSCASTVLALDGYYSSKPKDVSWFLMAKLASHPSVWALFVVYFCGSMCFYNLLSWTPVYFSDAFPESKGWVFNVLPWLANFLLANVSGYVANVLLSAGRSVTFVRKTYASIHLLGVALFALLLNEVGKFEHALFVMSAIVGFTAFANCSSMLNSQDLAPNNAGALHGLMNCNGAVAGFIGVYLTGYILQTTANWAIVFKLQAGMSFFAFLVYLLFGSGERVI